MLKFVCVLALAAVAQGGAPIGYAGGYATGLGYSTGLGYAGAAYAQPALRVAHAPVAAYHAAPVATYATAAYAQPALRVAHAPVAAYHAAPVAAYHAAPVYHAPAVAHVAKVAVRAEPYDPHPQYNYGYSVSDALTGDQKSAQESRDGDLVQGSYSLVEPDGAIRTVTYTADAVNGFNAVVNRQAPQVAVAKAVVAAPAFAVRAAPVAHYAHAAPLAVAHHGYGAGYAQLGYGGAYHH